MTTPQRPEAGETQEPSRSPTEGDIAILASRRIEAGIIAPIADL